MSKEQEVQSIYKKYGELMYNEIDKLKDMNEKEEYEYTRKYDKQMKKELKDVEKKYNYKYRRILREK